MDRRLRWTLALVLAGAVAVAFGGALGNGFIRLDDLAYVVENDAVRGGLSWAGVRYAFTAGTAANWHPLTWLSHMLDVELFGLDAGKHHATSVALHAANALLLFGLALRWIGRTWPAFFVAALFALHPLRVESVAWAAERKDVLCSAFFFLALHAWTGHVRGEMRAGRALALLAFALGLLAKPMLVTLPFLLLVLDFAPFARGALGVRRLVLEKLGFFALSAAACVATVVAQSKWGAVMTAEALPLGERVANALVSAVRYFVLWAWPAELALYYPHPERTPTGLALGAALVLAVASAVAWRKRGSAPWLLTGWLWYLGMLVPVIGIVQVGQQALADRYTYLPMIGPTLALVVVLAALPRSTPARGALAAVGVAVLALLVLRTRFQVSTWKDSRTVFAHAIRVTGDNAMARQNLGNTLLLEGDLDGAIAQLTECARISPAFVDVQNNLGSALCAKGRFQEGIACFERAIAYGQDSSRVRTNLGWALLQVGRAADAERETRKATELDPLDPAAREKLGVVLASQRRFDEALTELRRAVELAPNAPEPRRALALTLTFQGADAEAAAEYTRVLERSPDDVESLKGRAWLLATSPVAGVRDPAAARTHAERAVGLAALDDARAQDVLGAALAAAGDFDGAMRAAERSIELWRKQGRAEKAAEVEQRRALYAAHAPFTRPAGADR
jgi:tetratricopeptide (TPR) repeat protein